MTERQMRDALQSVLADLERGTLKVRRTARGVLLPTTLGVGLVLGGSVSCAAAPPRKKEASVQVDKGAGADAKASDAAKPDAAKIDAARIDAAKPDAGQDDKAKADTQVPDQPQQLVDAPCPPYMCPG